MNIVDLEIIQELAKLSKIAYDRVRVPSAKGLDVRPATLDKLVRDYQKDNQPEGSTPFITIEPYHDSISPPELLDEVAAQIERFIVCQEETVTAATLWIAMTWFIDVIQVAPIAVITAPEKRCGKSQLLFLLSRLVFRPIAASNITSAALFRSIDLWHPTLLIDEADTFMRENEEMRGLLNCGHTPDSAKIVRTVGEDFTPKTFNLWGAKAIAGIGKQSDTIMDRAIPLKLRRKKPEEHVGRLRHAESGYFVEIASRLARFAQDYSEEIRNARPNLPSQLNDRAQDNWEPLLAIAEIAGKRWLRRAMHAAHILSSDNDQSPSIGVALLTDIQAVIETMKVDRISTADLITALCNDQEKPWSTFFRGTPITPRQLANRLREFGIISNTIRLDPNTTAKGYMFSDFGDAFNRYLPSTSVSNVTTSQATNDGT
jgi:putative DNA primase/helicase